MPKGLYASLTPLPCNDEIASALILVFKNLIGIRKQEGRAGQVLNEIYAKVDDLSAYDKTMYKNSFCPKMGSSWALQCFEDHGYHYHSYSDDEKLLSFRRLLLFSNKGFTAEIYPIDFDSMFSVGPVEKFIVEGASLAELEFDGRMVHRFRPLNGGDLYSYSIHSLDLSDSSDAAKKQTYSVDGEGPSDVVERYAASPKIV